ncbi:MAG: hypothetical protein M3R54_05215 [Chloroflexota bacterium]|nr:hypothetical protein [Chloroflexota bacterium]
MAKPLEAEPLKRPKAREYGDLFAIIQDLEFATRALRRAIPLNSRQTRTTRAA